MDHPLHWPRVGQRVRLTENHLWSGCTGIIISYEMSWMGRRPLVRLERSGVLCFISDKQEYFLIQDEVMQ